MLLYKCRYERTKKTKTKTVLSVMRTKKRFNLYFLINKSNKKLPKQITH